MSHLDEIGSRFGGWKPHAHKTLRLMPNGTLFLLHEKPGWIHVCKLSDNFPGQKSLKAFRLSDGAFIDLTTAHGSSFVLF